jgi:hypothetical protein
MFIGELGDFCGCFIRRRVVYHVQMDLEILAGSRAGAKAGVDERPDIVRDDDYSDAAALQGVPFLGIAHPPHCLLWIARLDQSRFHSFAALRAVVALRPQARRA